MKKINSWWGVLSLLMAILVLVAINFDQDRYTKQLEQKFNDQATQIADLDRQYSAQATQVANYNQIQTDQGIRIVVLENNAINLCKALKQYAYVDFRLAARLEFDTGINIDRINEDITSAEAYCMGAIGYTIDTTSGDGYTVELGGVPVRNSISTGYYYPQTDYDALALYGPDDNFIKIIDLTQYVQIGYFIEVKFLPAKPTIVSYYDEQTHMAVLIRNMDGGIIGNIVP